MTSGRKLRVGVLFGGASSEHEVSLMSARSVLGALDPAKYDGVQIGITKEGRWLVDADAVGRLIERVESAGALAGEIERTEAVEKLFEHARGLAAEIGFELRDVPRTGGGSDGNFTAAAGVPTLDGLGIDGDGAHTLKEFGLLSSIAPRRRLMARLLETL